MLSVGQMNTIEATADGARFIVDVNELAACEQLTPWLGGLGVVAALLVVIAVIVRQRVAAIPIVFVFPIVAAGLTWLIDAFYFADHVVPGAPQGSIFDFVPLLSRYRAAEDSLGGLMPLAAFTITVAITSLVATVATRSATDGDRRVRAIYGAGLTLGIVMTVCIAGASWWQLESIGEESRALAELTDFPRVIDGEIALLMHPGERITWRGQGAARAGYRGRRPTRRRGFFDFVNAAISGVQILGDLVTAPLNLVTMVGGTTIPRFYHPASSRRETRPTEERFYGADAPEVDEAHWLVGFSREHQQLYEGFEITAPTEPSSFVVEGELRRGPLLFPVRFTAHVIAETSPTRFPFRAGMSRTYETETGERIRAVVMEPTLVDGLRRFPLEVTATRRGQELATITHELAPGGDGYVTARGVVVFRELESPRCEAAFLPVSSCACEAPLGPVTCGDGANAIRLVAVDGVAREEPPPPEPPRRRRRRSRRGR